VEDRVVYRLAPFGDDLDEGDQAGLHLLENLCHLRCLHLRLVAVQQGIVEAVLVPQRLGVLDGEVHDALQVRLEVGKVGLGAGLLPGLEGAGADTGALGDERFRHVAQFLVLAPGRAYQAGVVGVVGQAGGLGGGLFEQLAGLAGDEEAMREGFHRREVMGAGVAAAGGHVHLLIPSQDGSGGGKIGYLRQAFFQAFKAGAHFCLQC